MSVKVIPFTQGFLASSVGGKIFFPDGKEKKTNKNGDGYLTCNVLTKEGKWVVYGVQRLVAYAHLELPPDVDELHVNHRDGDIEFNDLINLEFITPAMNNIHAALLKGSRGRDTLLLCDENNVFSLMKDAYVFMEKFNVSFTDVWDAIKNGTALHGFKIKYLTHCAPLPKELHKEFLLDGKIIRTPRSVKVKNIETNEVIHFESLFLAGKHFNVTASHIYQCISIWDKHRLFKRKYLIVETNQDFPILDPILLRILLQITGKEVLALNLNDGKQHVFKSAAEFIRQTELSKKSVTVSLKNGRIRNLGGWLFTYNDSNAENRLLDVQINSLIKDKTTER